MSIRLLDENIILKIAAGEVIENPMSVVKELVENSIDACAKHIIIEINEGGTKLIKVSDDGIGFIKEDIEVAFLQHATSKLKSLDDLENITSYGFRGEALSSIASVSKVVLTTKSSNSKENHGYRYCIDFGEKNDLEEVASNVGSSIEVIDLFKNVPVRKKFLKGFPKENALVEDIVEKFALANPNISFNLLIDGRQKFLSNGDGNLKNIIYSLYGKEITDNLINVEYDDVNIKVRGYIAKPIIARNTRNDEIYFVNGRYVKSKIINNAIEEAYEGYLMQHKFPFTILNIDIDSDKVDVNVHPQKKEVRFSSDGYIYASVFKAINDKLSNIELIHEERIDKEIFNSIKEDNIDRNNLYDNKIINDVDIKSYENYDKNIDSLPSLFDEKNFKLSEGLNISNFNTNIHEKFEERQFVEKTLSEDHKYIGQIFNTYILVEFENKLYIIDQHAAHEKINYEKIMKSYKDGKVSSQMIFPSIVLRLTPLQYEAVSSNIDEFTKVGFEIELFGDSDIKVDSVPYHIFNIGNEKLLMDMIDSFTDVKNKEHYSSIAEKIASIACKMSIKANHILSETEVKILLRELFKLDNPYNCPHGRPTIISLSKSEFEKKFGRIV